MDYNQTSVKRNEFIVSVEWEGEGITVSVRNPHIDPGNSGDYEEWALIVLKELLAAGKAHLQQIQSSADESDS